MTLYLVLTMDGVSDVFERPSAEQAVRHKQEYYDSSAQLYVLVNEYAAVQATNATHEPSTRETGGQVGHTPSKRPKL